MLLKPLPVPAARDLVALYENAPDGVPDATGGTGRFLRFSYPRYERLQRALGSHGSLAAMTRSARFVIRLSNAVQATAGRGQLVSGNYFDTLSVAAAKGRTIEARDVRAGQLDAVAVISDGFWRRRFGSSDGAVGQTITVNNLPVTVIGVGPPGFVGIWTTESDSGCRSLYGPRCDAEQFQLLQRRRSQSMWISQGPHRLAEPDRARAGGGAPRANCFWRLRALLIRGHVRGRHESPQHAGPFLALEPSPAAFSGCERSIDALLALAAMVAVVLLVTCANIANLIMPPARPGWTSGCLSLGATTGRLIRQCLTESLMLAAAGTREAGGRPMGEQFLAPGLRTSCAPPMFSPTAPSALRRHAHGHHGVLFSLAPAIRATHSGRGASLGTNQRTAVGLATMRGMRPLVAAQLALSVVVVFAAVLLGRTLVNFTRVDPGFDVDRLVSVSFSPAASGYPPTSFPALGERLVTAMRELPVVTSAVVSVCGLVDGCFYSSGFNIEGAPSGASVQDNWVGAGYFATVGMLLVSGRGIEPRDVVGSPHVAVITESVARRFFAGRDPLGKRLGFNNLDTEIVGVVRDARAKSLRDPPTPILLSAGRVAHAGQSGRAHHRQCRTGRQCRSRGAPPDGAAVTRDSVSTMRSRLA